MTIEVYTGGLAPRSIPEALELASNLVRSGLVPAKTPQEGFALLLAGMEIGLGPMESMRGLYVVRGRVQMSADLLVALVLKSGLCLKWRTLESTPTACTIETHRKGDDGPTRLTWTMEDAERAGLSTQKDSAWKAYPRQMLRHRCAADLAREVYPDVVHGCYVPGELPDGEPVRLEPIDARNLATPPVADPGDTYVRRIESATSKELIAIGSELPTAALNGSSERVYLAYANAWASRFAKSNDLATLESFGKAWARLPTAVHEAVGGRVDAAYHSRETELTPQAAGDAS